jgi:hypothetical protein
VYFEEKADFAGILIGSMLYGTRNASSPTRTSDPFVRSILGVLIVLFFQCIVALFNPANRRKKSVKWGLVSYTVAMFSFATVLTGMGLNIESVSRIDNRDFPGIDGMFPPGPIGYQLFTWSGVLLITPSTMFLLNYWLADGLLVGSSLDAAPALSCV